MGAVDASGNRFENPAGELELAPGPWFQTRAALHECTMRAEVYDLDFAPGPEQRLSRTTNVLGPMPLAGPAFFSRS